MTPTSRRPRRTGNQRLALGDLRRIAGEYADLLTIVRDVIDDEGDVHVRVRLATGELDQAAGGLPVSVPYEEIIVRVSPYFPLIPPQAYVDHDRFVGHPHVLQGHGVPGKHQ